MRRALLVTAALIAASAWATEGRAQDGGFSDPFFLYYSYFLPRQAALAAQPSVNDSINANVADRQAYATTNRASLYDPNGGYGAFHDYDPNAVFEGGRNQGRSGTPLRTRGLPTSHTRGQGPSLYYNRAARYHPALRSGQGPNQNLAAGGRGTARPRGGAAGMGMMNAYSSMGVGMMPR